MPVQFSRTLRALRADSDSVHIWTTSLAIVFLTLWSLWLIFGSITVYVVSNRARLESRTPAHSLHAPFTGKIERIHVVLGQRVHAGDPTIELDSTLEREQIQREDQMIRSFAAQLEAARAELKAERVATVGDGGAANAELARAQAQLRMASSQRRQAVDDAARLRLLAADGMVPRANLTRAEIELGRMNAAVEAAESEVRRLASDGTSRSGRSEVLMAQRMREIAKIQADLAGSEARRDTLARSIDERSIRAATDGVIAELSPVRPGMAVTTGDYLGSIVASDANLAVVSRFDPDTALGRIRVGQLARIRLNSFPWPQYGTLTGRVRSVASEAQSGTARIELSLEKNPGIPIQHGLPGTVEIEIERLSPLQFVLRAAGQKLRAPPAASSAVTRGGIP